MTPIIGAVIPRVIAADTTRSVTANVVINSTAWTDFDNGLDIALPAAAGDWIEVAISTQGFNEAVDGYLDVVSVVSGAPVNSWAVDGAPSGTSQGVLAWKSTASVWVSCGGSIIRQLVAGDLSGGQVTLRVRARTASASNKTWAANANAPCVFTAKNLGPG